MFTEGNRVSSVFILLLFPAPLSPALWVCSQHLLLLFENVHLWSGRRHCQQWPRAQEYMSLSKPLSESKWIAKCSPSKPVSSALQVMESSGVKQASDSFRAESRVLLYACSLKPGLWLYHLLFTQWGRKGLYLTPNPNGDLQRRVIMQHHTSTLMAHPGAPQFEEFQEWFHNLWSWISAQGATSGQPWKVSEASKLTAGVLWFHPSVQVCMAKCIGLPKQAKDWEELSLRFNPYWILPLLFRFQSNI